MKNYDVYQVDSFTTEKFKGNPAGVVTNADGLSEAQMLQIARELNNSETVFIFSPQDASHDVRLRYFTPTVEVPSCGHATIAAHYVRSIEKKLDSCRVLQKIKIGTLPVDIVKDEDYKIWMTQGAVEFSDVIEDEERNLLLKALQLDAFDLAEGCPIQIVSTGHSKVLIGIKSVNKLHSLSPDLAALSALSAVIDCKGYFIFAFAAQNEDVLTHGRMFAPAIGIAEDPVTGNAHGPLGAYLVKHDLVKHDGSNFSFSGRQGEAIGRSGTVDVKVRLENGEPVEVQVGGRAVIAFKTQIEL